MGKYIVIQDWMVEELKLTGNDLLVFAIIYGFSQDGETKFNGNRQYIANWCGSTVRGIQKNLNRLVEKGLIVKTEKLINGIKFCQYATKFTTGEQSSLGGEQSSLGGEQSSLGGEQSSPNNIKDNIKDNINKKENIIKEKEKSNIESAMADDYIKLIAARKFVKMDTMLTLLKEYSMYISSPDKPEPAYNMFKRGFCTWIESSYASNRIEEIRNSKIIR